MVASFLSGAVRYFGIGRPGRRAEGSGETCEDAISALGWLAKIPFAIRGAKKLLGAEDLARVRHLDADFRGLHWGRTLVALLQENASSKALRTKERLTQSTNRWN
jgi:hypothetical protein